MLLIAPHRLYRASGFIDSRFFSISFIVFRFEAFSYGQFFFCGGNLLSRAYSSTSFSLTRHSGRITVIGNFSIFMTGAMALNAPWKVIFISIVSIKSSMLWPRAILLHLFSWANVKRAFLLFHEHRKHGDLRVSVLASKPLSSK